MKQCASCGASYDEGRAYCPECGVAADERLPELTPYDSGADSRPPSEPPAEPSAEPQPPTGGDPAARKHGIALLAVVALVVVGVVAYVVVQSLEDDDDRRSVPAPTSTTTEPTSMPTSDSLATTTNPPTPSTEEVGLVTVPAALVEQQWGMEVARLFDTYFAAINNRDFEAWKSVLKPADRKFKTQWEGLDSTHDSDIRLYHVVRSAQSMTADVSFTSRQDPADGPREGEECTHWDVTYVLVQGAESALLIDRVDVSRTTSRACVNQ